MPVKNVGVRARTNVREQEAPDWLNVPAVQAVQNELNKQGRKRN